MMVLVECVKIDTPSCVLRLGYIYTTICSNVYLLQTVIFYRFSVDSSLSLSLCLTWLEKIHRTFSILSCISRLDHHLLR